MIRFIIGIAYLLVTYIISWPLYIFELIYRRFNEKGASAFSFAMVQWIVRSLKAICGVRVHVTGLENLSSKTAFLYISNHRSFFDIIVTMAFLPSCTGFIAKENAMKVPLIHGWATRIHCLALNRSDIRQGLKVILSAIDNIKSGYSVFIYPEGTRSKNGVLGEFKAGSFKVATKTKCPIIPIAISGTAEIFDQHIPYVVPGDVYLDFGAPIHQETLSEEDRKHLSVYVHNIIDTMLQSHPQPSNTP